jgi:hypothetical protein
MKYLVLHVAGFIQTTIHDSNNKTDHHDITEILLKVALNTITQPLNLLCDSSQSFSLAHYYSNLLLGLGILPDLRTAG